MEITVEHLALPSKDPARLMEWYVKVLDGSVVFNNHQEPPTALVRVGGIMIEFYAGEKSVPETANNKLCGWRHLALRVPSIAAAKTELARRGVTFTEEPRPAAGGGQVLFFRDPEGNLLHLVERP
jgi:catechol 2,3-dioxygenase-like lactoylglutathione lyase family enzyme